MAHGTRATPEGYLTIAEARRRLGVSKMTMAKMLRRAGVATYRDPRDARVKLLKIEDVDGMMRPRPAEEGRQT